MYNVETYPTMLNALLHRSKEFSLVQKAVYAVAGSLLLTLAAKISIPFWPVNTTMNTLALVALGALLGPNLAVASVMVYLLEGAIGLPVFTSTPERGIGLAYMVGPSMGFLMGYIVAAYISGFLVQRGWGSTLLSAFGVVAIGSFAVYPTGITWMAHFVGSEAALANLLFWMPASMAKIGLGTALLLASHKWLKQAD